MLRLSWLAAHTFFVFCCIMFFNLVCQQFPSSAVQRVSDLQGTSIGDISGYTGPIYKIPALLGPHQLGPHVCRLKIILSPSCQGSDGVHTKHRNSSDGVHTKHRNSSDGVHTKHWNTYWIFLSLPDPNPSKIVVFFPLVAEPCRGVCPGIT